MYHCDFLVRTSADEVRSVISLSCSSKLRLAKLEERKLDSQATILTCFRDCWGKYFDLTRESIKHKAKTA